MENFLPGLLCLVWNLETDETSSARRIITKIRTIIATNPQMPLVVKQIISKQFLSHSSLNVAKSSDLLPFHRRKSLYASCQASGRVSFVVTLSNFF